MGSDLLTVRGRVRFSLRIITLVTCYHPHSQVVLCSVASVCRRVFLPVCVPIQLLKVLTIVGMQTHLQNIYVKFECQDHRVKVKVKVKAAKSVSVLPSTDRQCCVIT